MWACERSPGDGKNEKIDRRMGEREIKKVSLLAFSCWFATSGCRIAVSDYLPGSISLFSPPAISNQSNSSSI